MTTEGYDYRQIMMRNQHGGVTWEKTKVTGERTVNARLRSTQDKRMFDMLENNGVLEAYVEVKKAFDAITAAVRTSGMKLDGGGTACRPDDHGWVLQVKYKIWIDECHRLKLFPKIAMEIIGYGETPNAVDLKYRTPSGRAAQGMVDCLRVWGDIPKPEKPTQRV